MLLSSLYVGGAAPVSRIFFAAKLFNNTQILVEFFAVFSHVLLQARELHHGFLYDIWNFGYCKFLTPEDLGGCCDHI